MQQGERGNDLTCLHTRPDMIIRKQALEILTPVSSAEQSLEAVWHAAMPSPTSSEPTIQGK